MSPAPITVTPAANGGFAVYGTQTPGYERELLFAGTLVATLAYFQRRYTPPKKGASK